MHLFTVPLLFFKVLMEFISHMSFVDLNGPGYQLAAEKCQALRTKAT